MKSTLPRRRVMARIVVTPLVDVVLVLLVLFLVLTPLLVRSIDVREPHTTVSVAESEQLPPGQVVVQVRAGGGVWLNGEVIDPEVLSSRLGTLFATMETRVVFFQGDPEMGYGEVVHFLDVIRASGAEILAMAPEMRTEQVEATATPSPTRE